MKLYFCAYNIKIGGGKTLLKVLLEEFSTVDVDAYILVNEKLALPKNILEKYKIIRCRGGFLSRLYIEFWLRIKVAKNDQAIFFGNYPPIFRLKGLVKVFLQNRFLIDCAPSTKYSFQFLVKLALQKFLFKICLTHANEFYVQTKSMAILLKNRMPSELAIPIKVLPFVSDEMLMNQPKKSGLHHDSSYDFIYVATGEAHKNHKSLIDAWIILASEGYFPSLALTIDFKDFPVLYKFIEDSRLTYQLNVINLGLLKMADIKEKYRKSRALIFPSLIESFGLPMLEAKSFQLTVLAPELDYVRDVIDPDFTFDPYSPVSIARAVKRFLLLNESRVNLSTSRDFLQSIMEINIKERGS